MILNMLFHAIVMVTKMLSRVTITIGIDEIIMYNYHHYH